LPSWCPSREPARSNILKRTLRLPQCGSRMRSTKHSRMSPSWWQCDSCVLTGRVEQAFPGSPTNAAVAVAGVGGGLHTKLTTLECHSEPRVWRETGVPSNPGFALMGWEESAPLLLMITCFVYIMSNKSRPLYVGIDSVRRSVH